MGDIAFDEFSLPLWLEVRVRRQRSAEMPFLFSYVHAWVVMCQWLKVLGNDTFSSIAYGLGLGHFSGEIRRNVCGCCGGTKIIIF